jgi:hypothetical protein
MALAKQLGFEQRDGACYAELAKMIEKNKAREAAGWKSGAIYYKRHCDLKQEYVQEYMEYLEWSQAGLEKENKDSSWRSKCSSPRYQNRRCRLGGHV